MTLIHRQSVCQYAFICLSPCHPTVPCLFLSPYPVNASIHLPAHLSVCQLSVIFIPYLLLCTAAEFCRQDLVLSQQPTSSSLHCQSQEYTTLGMSPTPTGQLISIKIRTSTETDTPLCHSHSTEQETAFVPSKSTIKSLRILCMTSTVCLRSNKLSSTLEISFKKQGLHATRSFSCLSGTLAQKLVHEHFFIISIN